MAPNRTTNKRLAGALGAGAVVVGGLAYVGIGNPHSPSFIFPPCPFQALTGWNCPACGGLRMTHDLLHGDLAAAFVDNAFLLIGLPLLLTWVLVRNKGGRPVLNTSAFVVIIAAAVTWTVVRNLPGFPLVPTVLDG
ncbi:DUF2752 domain-containing protein [Mycolicibacterium pyrenivorans]|uniref:DUF2752 domain-containing protein n=1 Tax=Mycolicibacterium pyrenivorans TaxID=187102 RepID=UPI0021F379AD|nr:DUF2752 domain-containing protein [Mycolicibacterium pyrenivorans]MCV7153181.1 DUF2752 domain-containing protein [Mycolicibacterium pyrenivorans]